MLKVRSIQCILLIFPSPIATSLTVFRGNESKCVVCVYSSQLGTLKKGLTEKKLKVFCFEDSENVGHCRGAGGWESCSIYFVRGQTESRPAAAAEGQGWGIL